MKKNLIYLSILFFGLSIIFSCGSSDNQKDNETTDTENVKSDNKTEKENKKDKDLFTSEDKSFKIKFPGNPQLTKEPVETELGKIEMYTYMYEHSATKVYMVAYSDYPKAAIEAGDKDMMLDGAKSGFLKKLSLKIDEEKDIEIDGNQGLYFKAQGSGFYAVMKDYLVENRLYQVGILSQGSYPSDKEIDEFLNSFELLN